MSCIIIIVTYEFFNIEIFRFKWNVADAGNSGSVDEEAHAPGPSGGGQAPEDDNLHQVKEFN